MTPRSESRRGASGASWIVPTALVAGFGLLFFIEWHGGRVSNEESMRAIADALEQNRSAEKLESVRLRETIRGLRADLSKTAQGVLRLQREGRATMDPARDDAEPESVRVDPELGFAEEDELGSFALDDGSLPALPEGYSLARARVHDLDLRSFLNDPSVNPAGRELSRVDRLRAQHALVTARSAIDILESRLQLGVAEAVEALRDRGDFVSYEPGQTPEPVDGDLITAGEPGPEGQLVYYLDPEEYPELYETRGEQEYVAEVALRRLVAIARGEAGPVAGEPPGEPAPGGSGEERGS